MFFIIEHNMEGIITKEELIAFEKKIEDKWNNAEIPHYIHFSGGNEEQLIKIFEEIRSEDYKICSHRSHYHYLLSGGSKENLEKKIIEGKSMHIIDKNIKFISTAIVSGGSAIAVGISYALKKRNSQNRVWCFIGDGAEDEGHFYEAVRYVDGHQLPCKFIIEDNNRSVETPKSERYRDSEIKWPDCVKRYSYLPTYPHAGTGKFIDFSGTKLGTTM
jgi:TPP-dependent pyruvate/acetoin dehydrogenase alpha subunit